MFLVDRLMIEYQQKKIRLCLSLARAVSGQNNIGGKLATRRVVRADESDTISGIIVALGC